MIESSPLLRRGIEPFETVVGQDPVLARHGYQVGGNAHGHQIQKRLHPRKREGLADRIGLDQLEAYSAAREVVERIIAVVPFGIQYGSGIRQGLVGKVVVADDDVDALFLGIPDLLDSLDAAVEGDYQRVAVLACPVYTLVGYAVSLIVAVRNVVFDIWVEIAYKGVHQGHGRSPVHIVVSVDHHVFLVGYRFLETVDSLVHILHQEGIVKLGEIRLEELSGPLGCGDPALYQKIGQDLIDAQLRREGAYHSRVALFLDYPFFSIDISANLQILIVW